MTENTSKKLLTERDLRDQYFPVSRSTMYNWIRDGKLPVIRIGRQIFFSHEEIEKLIEANRSA